MVKPSKKIIVITYIAFITCWTLRIVLLKPLIDANLGPWARQGVNAALKLALWCGSAVCLIRRYHPAVRLKDMFRQGFSWRILGLCSSAAVLFHVGVMVVNGGIQIQPFHPSELISQFLVVGIAEELLFRGWFYNALRTLSSPWKANLISSALFVTSHYPSYVISGVSAASILYLSASIFLLSLLFGSLFERTKNIWVPIAFHSLWDLLQLFTVG